MSDEFAPAAPAPPPPRRDGSGRLGLLLVGALVGAIAGGAAAGLVARRDVSDLEQAIASSAPAGIPTPTAGTGARVEDPGLVVEVARDLSPSVVTVVNRAASGQQQASGSGFLVDAQRGYVLTNSHVVSNVRGAGVGASFEVIFADDRKVDARFVGRDPETDVAVLQVPRQDLKALALGNSDEAPIGATLIAIGSALADFRNSVTVGVLSGKGRRLQSESDANLFFEDLIQTDAAISPGNSGGPLIWAATKQVIGMNTLVIRARGSEGLGFAVSSNTVRRIADEIVLTGRVERGRIGVTYQPLTSRQALALGLPGTTSGVVIGDVLPGSPGAAAGLRAGDVVTKVNDQAIDEEHPLATIMLRFRPGDRVRLSVVRDGREQVVEVTLGRQ